MSVCPSNRQEIIESQKCRRQTDRFSQHEEMLQPYSNLQFGK